MTAKSMVLVPRLSISSLLLVFVAFVAIACNGTASSNVDKVIMVHAQTLASVASVGPVEVAIDGSFVNGTSAPVFLGHCDRDVLVTIERRVGSEEWRGIVRDPCPAFLQPPVKVGPGETRPFRVTARLAALLMPDEHAGEFRLVLAAYTDSTSAANAEGAALLDASLRRSPPFTVSR